MSNKVVECCIVFYNKFKFTVQQRYQKLIVRLRPSQATSVVKLKTGEKKKKSLFLIQLRKITYFSNSFMFNDIIVHSSVNIIDICLV